jgi:hypothetical protein
MENDNFQYLLSDLKTTTLKGRFTPSFAEYLQKIVDGEIDSDRDYFEEFKQLEELISFLYLHEACLALLEFYITEKKVEQLAKAYAMVHYYQPKRIDWQSNLKSRGLGVILKLYDQYGNDRQKYLEKVVECTIPTVEELIRFFSFRFPDQLDNTKLLK